MNSLDGLPILKFKTTDELHTWLNKHHDSSEGMWLRIYKQKSGIQSVSFEQVLDEGLCFGWSESKRRRYDSDSYLQRFTPRKSVGTQSARNLARAELLIREGRMMPSGLKALGKE